MKASAAGGVGGDIQTRIASEAGLTGALGRLMAISENYPDLKANQNFLDMQTQLANIEGELSTARRYYNGTVRENNIYVESFPSNLVAGWFGFKQGNFFEIAEAEKAVPKVSFKK
jgi:LemA protein